MPKYATLKRLPPCEEHHVAEHLVDPKGMNSKLCRFRLGMGEQKVIPVEALPPTTARWIAGLPREVGPAAIGEMFPHIANALATFWDRPDELANYFCELLVDRRGRTTWVPHHDPKRTACVKGVLRVHTSGSF